MKCPNCPESTLATSDRQGVEIDYCPQCRGVWLDRAHPYGQRHKSWLGEIFD
jgi:Zn-finger nucleic acid-binding protein